MPALHSAFLERPDPSLPVKADDFASQLITGSSNLALCGRLDGQLGDPLNRYPWHFIEVHEDVVKQVAENAGISAIEFLSLLNETLPRAVQANSMSTQQCQVHQALSTLPAEILCGMVTGSGMIAIENKNVFAGILHGLNTPPWLSAGPNSTEIDRLEFCLRGLQDFKPQDYESQSIPVVPMSWAAYVSPLVLFSTEDPHSPHIKSGIRGSSLAAPPGLMDAAVQQAKARETWGEFKKLAKAFLRSEPFKKKRKLTECIRSLIADSIPDSTKVIRAILGLTALKSAHDNWHADHDLYPKEWDESWGKDRCVPFLELLRTAGRKGVAEKELKAKFEESPSRVVSDMVTSQNAAKAELGKYLRQLRKNHDDGRYYLYPR
jgi:hypothetical protein